MLILKLGLIAASVCLASLAARRFGHAVGGALAGMPMIVGPLLGLLLLDHTAEQVQAIALGTLVCLPATLAHIVTFARCGFHRRWPICLAAANGAFLVLGSALLALNLPPLWVGALACVAPGLGAWAIPRRLVVAAPVPLPGVELAWRVLAAVTVAAVVILGAGVLPAAASGLLLAIPIAGNVLPCFTLPRHGAAATAALLQGFAWGLHGFVAFVATLYLALPHLGKLAAFTLALATSLAVALGVYVVRRRLARPAVTG
jgi:hypothetical protein